MSGRRRGREGDLVQPEGLDTGEAVRVVDPRSAMFTLRFGDPRVMALVGALCACLHVVAGFTNRSLRAQVSTLLGVPYSMGQMSYDLRRLRIKGLITRLPHSNTYVLTPDGQRAAIFYTKVTTGSCGHSPRPTTRLPRCPCATCSG